MWFTEVNGCIIRVQCSLDEALYASSLLLFEYMEDMRMLFIYFTNEHGDRCVISEGDLSIPPNGDSKRNELHKKFYYYESILENWQ